MKKTLKLFILLFSIVISVACFAFFGCTDNPDVGGNNGDTTGGNDDVTGGNDKEETFVSYELNDFVYSVTGFEEQYIDLKEMSSTDHATYDAVILTYGKQVKISDSNIQFVDGASLSAFGATGYTLNGETVTFTDSTLAEAFTDVQLSNGIFSLGIQQTVGGITIKYAFEYYSPKAVPPVCTVSFQSNGGSSVESKSVKKGNKVTAPIAPKKTGYTFEGWYWDKNCSKSWEFSVNKVVKDTVLYAKWTANENKVTFITNGDTANFSRTVYSGDKIYKPADPVLKGYVFVGWYADEHLTKEWNFETQITGAVTLYGKFASKNYTVSFDASNTILDVTYGLPIGELPIPQKDNFVFDGWYDKSNGGKLYTAGSVFNLTNNLKLFAKWSTKITLDTDGVVDLQKSEYSAAYGWLQSTVESLPSLERYSAKFLGWYTQSGGKGEQYTDNDYYNFDGAVTLYAAWQLTVSYDPAGGNYVNSTSVIKGNSFEQAETTRLGYTFAGWFDDDGNLVDETTIITKNTNFKLTAKWTANDITFLFDTQGGEAVSSREYTYDSPLGDLPTPEKQGNVFGGWYTQTAGGGMLYDANSICDFATTTTLYAKWTADIIFEYEGATSDNIVEKIGFAYKTQINITLPQPYKVGWSFEGWFTSPDGEGRQLLNNAIQSPSSSVWDLQGNTQVYAYWVKGIDKRFINFTESQTVTVTGLKDTSLTELEIPAIINLKPVTGIGANAFSGVPLVAATVPDNVTAMGRGVFTGCPLEELTLPFVGGAANVNGETALLGYLFDRKYTNWSGQIEGAVYQGYNNGFDYYWYFIPKTLAKVTVTGNYPLMQNSFMNCTMLNEVNFEGNITAISANAFNGCTELVKITGLDAVTRVNEYAFNNCKKLVTFPQQPLTQIGAYAFYNCVNLNAIAMGEGLTSIGNYAFVNTALTAVDMPEGVESVGEYAFQGAALTLATVPNSVTSMGRGVFAGCPLEELTLPFVGGAANVNGETALLGYLFNREYTTWSGQIEGAVYQGYNNGFEYYWYFIPQTLAKVTVTGNYPLMQNSFMNCTMIKEINIAGNVSNINDGSLVCANLEVLRFGSQPPQTVSATALTGISGSVVIVVPQEYLNDYKELFTNFTVTTSI